MTHRYLRRAGMVFAAAIVTAFGGCSDALQVNNPKLIDELKLDDPKLVPVLMNSAIGELAAGYTEFVWYSAILTDEAVNGTNDYGSAEQSQRIVELAQGNRGPYRDLQRFRATADTMASRIKALVASPQSDLRAARTVALAGYGYELMAEELCASPINLGPMQTSAELSAMALTRFKDAIAIATAGRTGSTGNIATADSILNLARVGAARTALQIGNKAEAITFANAVSPNFVWYVQYQTSANTRLQNSLWSRVASANKQLGVHPLMQDLNDPRVRYHTPAILGHNQLTKINWPYVPRTFKDFDITKPTDIQQNSWVELASGLEARYIVAEASGPNATTLALVNERRAFGNQTTVALAGDALMAELREQRRRDFYLSAKRLGDLRRYKAQGAGDFFPSGIHPNKEWGLYGKAECYIIAQDEMNSNPNIRSYVPPSTRP
jgi:hypothetical protein